MPAIDVKKEMIKDTEGGTNKNVFTQDIGEWIMNRSIRGHNYSTAILSSDSAAGYMLNRSIRKSVKPPIPRSNEDCLPTRAGSCQPDTQAVSAH